MWRRTLFSLLIMLGLIGASLHAPAMASAHPSRFPASITSPQVSAEPETDGCHESAPKAQPDKAKATPDCCSNGCGAACSPVATFFASAPQRILGFLRSIVEAEALAGTPVSRSDARERPPKSHA